MLLSTAMTSPVTCISCFIVTPLARVQLRCGFLLLARMFPTLQMAIVVALVVGGVLAFLTMVSLFAVSQS